MLDLLDLGRPPRAIEPDRPRRPSTVVGARLSQLGSCGPGLCPTRCTNHARVAPRRAPDGRASGSIGRRRHRWRSRRADGAGPKPMAAVMGLAGTRRRRWRSTGCRRTPPRRLPPTTPPELTLVPRRSASDPPACASTPDARAKAAATRGVPRASGKRQDLGAAVGDGDRVLEVGRQAAVGRDHGPPVVEQHGSPRPPAFTMGSTANTIPGRSFGPLPGPRSWAPRGFSCMAVPMAWPTYSRTTENPAASATVCTAWPMSDSRLPSTICVDAGPQGSSVTSSSRGASSADLCRRGGEGGVAVVPVDDRPAVDRDDVALLRAAYGPGMPWTIIELGDVQITPGTAVGSPGSSSGRPGGRAPPEPPGRARAVVTPGRMASRIRRASRRRPGRPGASWRSRPGCASRAVSPRSPGTAGVDCAPRSWRSPRRRRRCRRPSPAGPRWRRTTRQRRGLLLVEGEPAADGVLGVVVPLDDSPPHTSHVQSYRGRRRCRVVRPAVDAHPPAGQTARRTSPRAPRGR